MPEDMTPEMWSLLEGLLKRDVDERIGCKGRGYVTLTVINHFTHADAYMFSKASATYLLYVGKGFSLQISHVSGAQT